MKDATRRRNARIVDVWNMGVNTLAELGQAFHLPRNSIGRILWESRQDGVAVLKISAAESSARMSRAQRRKGRAETKGPGPVNRADGGQTTGDVTPNPTL